MDELICLAVKGCLPDHDTHRLNMWRKASGENEAYYQDLVSLLEEAQAAMLDVAVVAVPARKDLVRLDAEEDGDEPAIVRARHGATAWQWTAVGLLAATIVFFAFSVAFRPLAPFNMHAGEFVTGPAETATAVLDDGTVVRLAPNSRLSVPGIPGIREVILEGQAYFAVARMESYPFRVRTEAGEATVLGTRFEVLATEDELRLLVMEGRVALEGLEGPIEVGAGEISLLREGVGTTPALVEDMEPFVAWLKRFIVFQETPLRDAVIELEREYGVPITITDPVLAAETITGWYADRELEDVLTLVCGVLQARCSIEEGRAVVRPR